MKYTLILIEVRTLKFVRFGDKFCWNGWAGEVQFQKPSYYWLVMGVDWICGCGQNSMCDGGYLISCCSYRSRSAPTIFHQLLSFETLEFTSTAMSWWGLTSRKRYRPATRYCVNCGVSVGQCRDLCFSRWCRLSSSRGWTTAIRHSPAFHRMSCHGCSQWWMPSLGSSFPRQSSSTLLRSFVSCTGWRLHSGLHSNMLSWCASVYTGPHLHTLLTSFVRWQMSRLVSDSVPVHPRHWLSAASDSLPSVTELSRSPLHVSGTVCQILSLPHLL